MSIEKSILIIFAKSPRSADVKTRLSPLLSKKERARLQSAFILDTLSLTADRAGVAPLSVTRALACTPEIKDHFFMQCEKKHSVLLIKQEGPDLGERMKNAFCWAFSRGFQRVVIIGSDTPTLPTSFIKQAFIRLRTVPIVLGPAIDGGYYLIGAKWPVPDIFNNIKWGSNTVLSDTIMRLKIYHLLPFWYDIDYPKDVYFLIKHLSWLTTQRDHLAIETLKLLIGIAIKK
jgi:hypothetical protein